MRTNDKFAVKYECSDETNEMNDAVAALYDWCNESVERNDVVASDESVGRNEVFAMLDVSSCGSIRGTFGVLDVSSGRPVKGSKMLDVFTLSDDSGGKSVKGRVVSAVLEDSSGESLKNDVFVVLDDSSLDWCDESVEKNDWDPVAASDSSIR